MPYGIPENSPQTQQYIADHANDPPPPPIDFNSPAFLNQEAIAQQEAHGVDLIRAGLDRGILTGPHGELVYYPGPDRSGDGGGFLDSILKPVVPAVAAPFVSTNKIATAPGEANFGDYLRLGSILASGASLGLAGTASATEATVPDLLDPSLLGEDLGGSGVLLGDTAAPFVDTLPTFGLPADTSALLPSIAANQDLTLAAAPGFWSTLGNGIVNTAQSIYNPIANVTSAATKGLLDALGLTGISSGTNRGILPAVGSGAANVAGSGLAGLWALLTGANTAANKAVQYGGSALIGADASRALSVNNLKSLLGIGVKPVEAAAPPSAAAPANSPALASLSSDLSFIKGFISAGPKTPGTIQPAAAPAPVVIPQLAPGDNRPTVVVPPAQASILSSPLVLLLLLPGGLFALWYLFRKKR